MTEVAMLHSKLHADTKSVNGKWLSARQVPRREAYQDDSVSMNELQQKFLSKNRAVCRLSGLCKQ